MRDKAPFDFGLNRPVNQVSRIAMTEPGAEVAQGLKWRAVGRLKRPYSQRDTVHALQANALSLDLM